jgi:hypothetical protein
VSANSKHLAGKQTLTPQFPKQSFIYFFTYDKELLKLVKEKEKQK